MTTTEEVPVNIACMYKATEIAAVFVQKGIDDKKPVTQMQVQKLVYFAHGLHLALTGEPLIYEQFQAWRFGPVVPSIYQRYKFEGASPILETSIGYTRSQYPPALEGTAKQAVNNTWDILKDLSGSQLSNWTHKSGLAWSAYYRPDEHGSIENDIIIPNSRIREDFLPFIKEV